MHFGIIRTKHSALAYGIIMGQPSSIWGHANYAKAFTLGFERSDGSRSRINSLLLEDDAVHRLLSTPSSFVKRNAHETKHFSYFKLLFKLLFQGEGPRNSAHFSKWTVPFRADKHYLKLWVFSSDHFSGDNSSGLCT